MDKIDLLALVVVFVASCLYITRRRISRRRKYSGKLASLPVYYYSYSIWLALSFSLFVIAWTEIICSPLLYINQLLALPIWVAGVGYVGVKCFFNYRMNIRPGVNVLKKIELLVKRLLFLAALISIAATLVIVSSIFFEAIRFFNIVSPLEFLFGLSWNPESDLVDGNNFGAIPVFIGTLLITLIAIVIAVPFGLLSAIFLTEYASKRTRTYVKPILEMLAGIPTVVYGYFAALTAAPLIRRIGEALGLNVASESAFAAGLVMGIMIIPFVLSVSDDVLNAVPQNLRDAALALGSTKAETITKVLIPAALPGIMGAILLAISRAIGETMIVTMASGLQANLTFNPFSSVTTVTAQIVSLIVGDQEFESAKTLSAFALALVLFLITLSLNMIALMIVNRYRERYE
jgi:phosphate transport system permease protein